MREWLHTVVFLVRITSKPETTNFTLTQEQLIGNGLAEKTKSMSPPSRN